MGLLSFNPLRGGSYALLAALAAAMFAPEKADMGRRETVARSPQPNVDALAPLPPPRPAAVAPSQPAKARKSGGDRIAGPVAAVVERVVDGDTLAVRARIWVGEEVRVLVRLRGIDTPEMKGRCDRERDDARRAAALLARLVGDGEVRLSDIAGGKYFGRVVADVSLADGRDPARALLAAGLARPYGGGARAGWCDRG